MDFLFLTCDDDDENYELNIYSLKYGISYLNYILPQVIISILKMKPSF